MKDEYIDMLLTGNHKKTADEHHAYAKASRKRVKEGRDIEARRKARAKTNYKFKPILEAL
jgi:hypothetical protein